MQHLAQEAPEIARGVAIGITTQAAGSEDGTDSHLTYEIARSPVHLVSADYVDNKIIFKTTIADAVAAEFNEVGLFTLESSETSDQVTTFDELGWTAGTLVDTNSRLGTESLMLNPAAGDSILTEMAIEADWSEFTKESLIKFAYHADANVAGVEIAFYTEDTAATYSFTPANGYAIEEFTLADLTDAGIDRANITRVSVEATSGAAMGELTLDGIRIDSHDVLNQEEFMVARAILEEPRVKRAGLPMDVEFHVEVTL